MSVVDVVLVGFVVTAAMSSLLAEYADKKKTASVQIHSYH